jgi:glucose/arabinose dehydrogenase
MLRSFQNDAAPEPPGQGDAAQPPRGNHNGGIIGFGADEKLYILIGDEGRRGQLQNLPSGPTATGLGPRVPDDQFGGPEPDNAHLTGVILRLNDNGSIPRDNPFFRVRDDDDDDKEDEREEENRRSNPGQIRQNIRRVFAYGIRNSFGMTFDPISGAVWISEHGDDAFDELNRVPSGMNGGWVQIMGPIERLAQYKSIEVGRPGGLQQLRWPPERIADSAQEAMRRLFQLPGSQLVRPAFSWKFAALPVGLSFVRSNALGADFRGNLIVGVLGNPQTAIGYLFRFRITPDRMGIAPDDPRVRDLVADNNDKYDLTESESFIIGSGFGNVTDIENAPNGNLYVVSFTEGAVYEVFRP